MPEPLRQIAPDPEEDLLLKVAASLIFLLHPDGENGLANWEEILSELKDSDALS